MYLVGLEYVMSVHFSQCDSLGVVCMKAVNSVLVAGRFLGLAGGMRSV